MERSDHTRRTSRGGLAACLRGETDEYLDGPEPGTSMFKFKTCIVCAFGLHLKSITHHIWGISTDDDRNISFPTQTRVCGFGM